MIGQFAGGEAIAGSGGIVEHPGIPLREGGFQLAEGFRLAVLQICPFQRVGTAFGLRVNANTGQQDPDNLAG